MNMNMNMGATITMAKMMMVVGGLVLVMICCHLDSVCGGGEMGGSAVHDDDDYDYDYDYDFDFDFDDYPISHLWDYDDHLQKDNFVKLRSYNNNIPKSSSSSESLLHSKNKPPYRSSSAPKYYGFALFVTVLFGLALVPEFAEESVLMIQVAFDDATDQIQRDLDLISMVSDTVTRRGLHSLLSKTASRVCRYPESCFSVYSKVNKKMALMGGWKKCFDLTYREEMKKVDALVSVNDCGEGTRRKRPTCPPYNKYVIVTILVGTSGVYELPAINCYSDLDRAIRSLTSINYRSVKAVKVLWSGRDNIEDLQTLRHLWD